MNWTLYSNSGGSIKKKFTDSLISILFNRFFDSIDLIEYFFYSKELIVDLIDSIDDFQLDLLI